MAAAKTVELQGQSLALAKLSGLGFVCSLSPTNAPDVDIQGYHNESRKPILVQVKTASEPFNWQLSADEFLIVEKTKQADGRFFMQVRDHKPIPQQKIFWIFVKLSDKLCETCNNRFNKYYICTLSDVQEIAERKFTTKLTERNGYRKSGGPSTHFQINESDLSRFTDWSIIMS